MSRSYKKYPGFRDTSKNGSKKDKRIANKRVRKNWLLPEYGGYKKASQSYDIHDYNFRFYSREELKEVHKENNYLKEEEVYKYWIK